MTALFAPYAPAPVQADEPRGMTKLALELLDAREATGPLAVFNFEVQGGDPRLGILVADRLSAELKKGGNGVRVVDRKKVLETVSLHALEPEGFPDHAELKRLAPMLGARQIVLGTITCTGKKGLINAMIVVPSNGLVASRSQMAARCP